MGSIATLDSFSLFSIISAGVIAVPFLLRRPQYALFLVSFTIPIESLVWVDGLGTLPRLFGAAFIVSHSVNLIFMKGRRFTLSIIPAWGWIWMVWLSLSLFWSVEPDLIGLRMIWQVFVFALLVADFVSRRPDLIRPIMVSYSAGAVLVSALAVLNFLAQSGGIMRRFSAFDGQSVAHFASYLIPAILFLLHEHLTTKRKLSHRLFGISLLGLLLFGFLISGTRSAWVALIIAGAIVFIRYIGLRQMLIGGALAAVVYLIVIQFPSVAEFIGRRIDTALVTGGAGRIDIWKVGLGIFADNPIIGVGFRSFGLAFTHDAIANAPIPVSNLGMSVGRAPHNIYLSVAAELGLIGLALWTIWKHRLLLRQRLIGIGFVVQAIVWSYMLQGFFLDILIRTYFWLFVGILHGLVHANGRRPVSA